MVEKTSPDFWLMAMPSIQAWAAASAVSLNEIGRGQRPACGKAESQVLRVQVLQGAARLDDHRFRIVAGDRQRGPSAGYLPDQVAGLVVRLGVLQDCLSSENSFSRLQFLFDAGWSARPSMPRWRAHPQAGPGIQCLFRQGGQPVQNGCCHAAKMQTDCPVSQSGVRRARRHWPRLHGERLQTPGHCFRTIRWPGCAVRQFLQG